MTTPHRIHRSDTPILSPDTAERIRRYEMRHTPGEFIRLFCNWNIRPWPYTKNEEGNR